MVPQRRAALEALVLHAATLRIPVVELEGGTLTSLAGFDGHQGVALVVEGRHAATIDEVLARAVERGQRPFVLALDSLEDPQNLGTLLRSAEACGVQGVILPTRRAAPLTPAAIKASAGAVEHLLLLPAENLAQTLTELHGRGLRLIGADAEAPLTYREADLRGPVAVVIGSEGGGLSAAVRRRLDLLVRIPMGGQVASLNAAVAGSVLLFEVAAQRSGGGPWGDRPEEATGDAPSTPIAKPQEAKTAPKAPRAKPKRSTTKSKASTSTAKPKASTARAKASTAKPKASTAKPKPSTKPKAPPRRSKANDAVEEEPPGTDLLP